MANHINKYDRLYNNMKENLTVKDGDCSIGKYMLNKAARKKSEENLPVAMRSDVTRGERTLAIVRNYVEDKLAIKAPPQKDTIIRSFPLRTSGAAFLAATVVCTFLLSFCLIGSKVLSPNSNLEVLKNKETVVEEMVDTADNTAALIEE